MNVQVSSLFEVLVLPLMSDYSCTTIKYLKNLERAVQCGSYECIHQVDHQVAVPYGTLLFDSLHTGEAAKSPVQHQTNRSLCQFVFFVAKSFITLNPLTPKLLLIQWLWAFFLIWASKNQLGLTAHCWIWQGRPLTATQRLIQIRSRDINPAESKECHLAWFVCNFAQFLPILLHIECMSAFPKERWLTSQLMVSRHRNWRTWPCSSSHNQQDIIPSPGKYEPRASHKLGCKHTLIKSWMDAFGMASRCDIRHRVWSDCLLILNRKVLDDIMIAERNHFTSSSLDQFWFNSNCVQTTKG